MEILLIAMPVLTIIAFVWYFLRQRRLRKPKSEKVDDRTRLERAVWAWARILSSNQGPVNSYRMARVEMQLEIHMPGTPAYQASTTWLVDEEALASVEADKEISLKVDPQGLEYIYPSGSWAKQVK
jgi:hypothetical protein